MPAPFQSVVRVDPESQVVRFRLTDGSEQTLVGPAAMARARTLPAAGPAPEGLTEGAAAQYTPSTPEPEAPTMPTATPVLGPGPGPARPQRGATASWEPEAPAGGAPPAPPQATPQTPPLNPVQEAFASEVLKQAFRPSYTPGVNPQKMLETGVNVPTGGSQKVEGGMDPATAKKFAALYEDAHTAAVESQLAVSQDRIASADAQRAAAEAAIPRLEAQREQEQAKLDEMHRRYNEHLTQLQGDLSAAYSREIDPRRVFKNQSTLQTITGILGMAILQGVSARTGAPNIGWQAIQQQVDKDIRSQEAAIRSGISKGQTALELYRERYGGDTAMAKAALGATMEQIAQAQAMRLAGKTGREGEQQRIADWIASTGSKYIDRMREFDAAARGKVTQEVNERFVVPQAGGAGAPSLERLGKSWDLYGKITGGDLERKRAEAEATATGKAQGLAGGGFQKRVDSYLDEIGKLAPMEGTVADVAMNAGLKRTAKGEWVIPKGADLEGVGALASKAPSFLLSDKGKRARQGMVDMVSQVLKDRSGATVTEPERERLESMMRGRFNTESEFAVGMNIIQRYVSIKKEAARAKAGAPTVRAAEQQSGAVQEMTARQQQGGEEWSAR